MERFWKRLVRSVEIPFDPLHENSNRENVISALINLTMLMLGLYVIPVISERGFNSPQILLIFIMLLILAGLRVALHKVGARIVSMFLVLSFWVFFNVLFLFFENGLRAPTYIAGIAFTIVYVGLLHGQRSIFIITLLSVITGLAVGLLELAGIFLTQPRIPDIRWAMIALVIVYPIMAFMIARTLRNYRQSIILYRAESEKREISEQNVLHLNQELENAYATTLEGWARALELRDKETEGHSRRVIELTTHLSRVMGVDEAEIKYISYGAMLHDIGKMGIPDAILRKPGALTDEEWEIIRQHPVLAYDLLKDIQYLKPALAIPYSHHENWDGSGYPQGLKGEDIPLPARIFRVVDNWDALSTDRPYRNAWPRERVIEYLKTHSNSIFDARVVDVFLSQMATHNTW